MWHGVGFCAGWFRFRFLNSPVFPNISGGNQLAKNAKHTYPPIDTARMRNFILAPCAHFVSYITVWATKAKVAASIPAGTLSGQMCECGIAFYTFARAHICAKMPPSGLEPTPSDLRPIPLRNLHITQIRFFIL